MWLYLSIWLSSGFNSGQSTSASGDIMVNTLQLLMPLDLTCYRRLPSDIRLSRRLASEKLVYFTSVSEHLAPSLHNFQCRLCNVGGLHSLRMSCRVSSSRTVL